MTDSCRLLFELLLHMCRCHMLCRVANLHSLAKILSSSACGQLLQYLQIGKPYQIQHSAGNAAVWVEKTCTVVVVTLAHVDAELLS